MRRATKASSLAACLLGLIALCLPDFTTKSLDIGPWQLCKTWKVGGCGPRSFLSAVLHWYLFYYFRWLMADDDWTSNGRPQRNSSNRILMSNIFPASFWVSPLLQPLAVSNPQIHKSTWLQKAWKSGVETGSSQDKLVASAHLWSNDATSGIFLVRGRPEFCRQLPFTDCRSPRHIKHDDRDDDNSSKGSDTSRPFARPANVRRAAFAETCSLIWTAAEDQTTYTLLQLPVHFFP